MNELFMTSESRLELRYRLVIPKASPSNNVIRGLHFQKYRQLRKAWQMELYVALKGRTPKEPLSHSFLSFERAVPGSGLDWDNVVGGLKPIIDCLVTPSSKNPDGLGLIVNDDLEHMPYQPRVTQVVSKGTLPQTTIEVFEVISLTN